jgi:hypothetical protein
MNWSNIFSKVKHALFVGAGTGVGILVTALTGGTAVAALPFALAGKGAAAAAAAYMVKSARPEVK